MFRPPAQVVGWLPVCASVFASVCQCVDRTPNWFSQIHSHHQVSPYLLIHYHLQSAYKYKVWICVLPQMKLNPKFICIWLIGLHSTGPPNAQTCFLATFEPQIWRWNMSAPAAPLRFVANRMKFSWSKELDSRLLNYLACDCPLPEEFSQSDSRLFWC